MYLHNTVSLFSNLIRRYGVFIVVTVMVTFGTFFVYNGRGEIAEALSLIASINPVWILVLGLLQVFGLLVGAWAYQVVLRRQGYELGVLRLIEIHLQRVVIGAVTPIGGPASIYVLVRALRKHNVSDSDTLILATIKSITGVIAFLIFLVPALLLQTPSTMVLMAATGLLVVLGFSLWAISVILRSGDVPDFLQGWMPERVMTFVRTAKAHRMTPGDFVLPTMFAFLSHVATAFMLFAGLQAVGYPATISTVLIGYVVGKLFFMMAPVFQGIGIVEIGMALALQQAGVPSAVAVSGALLYRVGDLWLPLSWGFMVHLVRVPVLQHLREAKAQAGSMVSSVATAPAGLWDGISIRTARLSRIALVTEAPLALTAGVILAMAADLPFIG
jgi:uncharacterized membrane protein YbhN (UPF0104 family)